MPRPTRSQGRTGTPVIPTGWTDSHRPVAEQTMRDATVRVRRPGATQAWSDAEQQMVETPIAPYYDGPARIRQLAPHFHTTVAAGERVATAHYLVVVPADVTPAVDDLVTVTEVDDGHLQSRSMVVAQVTAGSLRWERDVYCTLTD